MPRNSAGTYTLPEAPFTPGTTISSAAVNSDFDDIAEALTGSLARDGSGGMTGQFKALDGTVDNPGISFGSDLDTGFRRSATGTIKAVSDGDDIVTINSSGISVAGAVAATSFTGAGIIPIGAMLEYAGSTAPTGYLLCYGQAISRTDYAALFAAISTAYGVGDGSTTFNVPDRRGRVSAGKDNMGGSAASRLTAPLVAPNGETLGAVGGFQTIGLEVADLPAHGHAVGTLATASAGAHTHDLSLTTATVDVGAAVSVETADVNKLANQTALSAGAHTHTLTGSTADTGSGSAHDNVQPTLVNNVIIRAL